MIRKTLHIFISALAATFLLCGCIEDGFTESSADRPSFSVDTLKMGVVFTDEATPTFSFKVFNPNKKGLNISNVSLSGDNASIFRLNVDGFSGTEFKDVEIRANDSIFVFVQATPPAHGKIATVRSSATVNFLVNGVHYPVVLTLDGQDIERISGLTVTSNMTLTADRPYRVSDSIVVAPGATLTLEPGTTLLMHDKSYIAIDGTFISKGTPERPIRITGDRMGEVIPDVSFDIMSRQWAGMFFSPSSRGSVIEFTEICNTTDGVTVLGDGSASSLMLSLRNSRLRNSGARVLTAIDATIDARGCEFAEAASGLVLLNGGSYRFDLCTLSNNYLFSAISGAAWQIPELMKTPQPSPSGSPTMAYITNSITYGLGTDVDPGDLAGSKVIFERCMFKATGSDDDNFVSCLWDADPLFYTVREDYLFDYRLQPDSPAVGAAHTSLSEIDIQVDFYGNHRNSDLGAYVYVPL